MQLDAEESARLKKPSPPPRNRIAEYESALALTPPRRSEGPIFEVVKKSRKAGDKSSPIAKLPNGILLLVTRCPYAQVLTQIQKF